MASYRVYKALYPFTARDTTEVSMLPEDFLFVYMKEDGTWPNDSAWMKGTNYRTNETGDFPGGNYSELVKEVIAEPPPPPQPQPAAVATPPPPPPRRGRAMSPPTNSNYPSAVEEVVPAVQPRHSVSPAHVRQHDLFKITIQLPLVCVVCDDYIWGSAGAGYRCQYCSVACHSTCQEACKKAVKCDTSLQAPEDSSYRDYAYTVSSFLDFTETDVESWMKAANIDVYWECFKNGGITTGRRLQELDENSLRNLGISDELHLQIVMECLNELCRPTQVSMLGLPDDQPDIGAWKRLSGQFAINLVRSPSTFSVSATEKESKKKGERTIHGHSFSVHSYATPTKCDFCSRYMLGLIRQGLKCKICNKNVHKMCLRDTIPTCDQWRAVQASNDVFGVELATQFDCQRERAPPVVLKCIEMVEEKGLRVEGIYRVSASLGDVNKLKEEFNKGVTGINIRDSRWSDVHVFSGALKLYLRDLPEPVFTYHMYSDFVKAGRSSKDFDALYKNIQPLVDNLPAHNKMTLETILQHLIKVVNEQQYNKMTHNNLALVFGPTLMRPKPDQIAELVGNCDVHCRIVDVLLQKGPWNIKMVSPPDVSSLRGVKPAVGEAPPIPLRAGGKRTGSAGTVPLPRIANIPVPLPEEADGPPPATPTSSATAVPLSECGWYWQDISREDVTLKLKEAPDGSFLVRDSQRGAYTLTVKKGGQNKLVRIINANGLYGFSEPTQYRSVPDLIDHYREVSLSQYNPRLDVKLVHPVSRFAKISEVGAEEEEDEDRENDVEELLEKLKDATENFDAKNETYLELEKKSESMKTEVNRCQTSVTGFSNVVELLKEQWQFLRNQDISGARMKETDRRNVMDNVKLLGDRIALAENSHRQAITQQRECNNVFRALDRDLNTLRPELMRLQWEKDQYTSKLVQEGLNHHEISERVKEKAMNESESIYGTLYGTLEEGLEEDEEDGGIYEPPPEIQHIQYPGPPPPPRVGGGGRDEPRPPPPIPRPELGPPPPARRISNDSRPIMPLAAPAPPNRGDRRIRPVPNLEDRPHNRQETWYVECDRAHAEMHLRGKQDGTFLCRPSGKAMQNAKGGLHTHTIDIVYFGIKHLKVVQDSNKYGFSVPCVYGSLMDLILHYSENSLETHNPKLTTTLAYPVYS